MKMLRIDLANHAWIGAYCALAGWLLLPLLPWQAAALGCVLAAVGREVYGLWRNGRFDPLDIAATLLGGVPVVLVA